MSASVFVMLPNAIEMRETFSAIMHCLEHDVCGTKI